MQPGMRAHLQACKCTHTHTLTLTHTHFPLHPSIQIHLSWLNIGGLIYRWRNIRLIYSCDSISENLIWNIGSAKVKSKFLRLNLQTLKK